MNSTLTKRKLNFSQEHTKEKEIWEKKKMVIP